MSFFDVALVALLLNFILLPLFLRAERHLARQMDLASIAIGQTKAALRELESRRIARGAECSGWF